MAQFVVRVSYLIEVAIGLYRDVWIAASASSRTRLATLMGNVERNSHCDVLHFAPVRVANLVLDCNGVFAIKAYGAIHGSHCLMEVALAQFTVRIA